MTELQRILRQLDASRATGVSPGVLATLVTVAGSSYRRPGARLLYTPEGHRIGSISGGCLDEDVLARAARVAKTGVAELAVYDTTVENDQVWGVGLGCHGVVQILLEKLPALRPAWITALAANLNTHDATPLAVVWRAPASLPVGTRLANELPPPSAETAIFFETVAPPTALFIYGAGDDAQPLVRLAKELGWHVTIADPRPAFATIERFPSADAIIAAPALELVERTSPSAGALAVVMTHHYVHDVPLLRDLLPRPLAYLGLLGPKQRAERILSDLARDGLSVTPADRARLHAPVGLDLGAVNPEEVALSILAEMRALLAGRDARPLRERQKPIHG